CVALTSRGAKNALQDIEAEFAADNSGDGEHLVRLVGEAGKAAADDVAQAVREDAFVDGRFRLHLIAAALPHDKAFLDQIAQNFLDEERVSLRLAVNELGLGPGDALAPDRLVHAVDFVDREAPEEDTRQAAEAAEL